MSGSSKTEILARIRSAVAGRVASVPERGSQSFVHTESGNLSEVFLRNLTAINGIGMLFPDLKSIGVHIKSLIREREWHSIMAADQQLARNLGVSFNEKIISHIDADADVALTGCEALVADLGSVLVSSGLAGSRQSFILPPVHIVIASVSQIAPTLDSAFKQLMDKYKQDLPSAIITISGPSRTADIEKTLILGAHGPKELYVLISEKVD